MSLKAFLLCAGEGMRFRPHTKTLSKVLLPFLNLPIVFHNLFLLKKLGVKSYVSNICDSTGLLKRELKKCSVQPISLEPTFSIEDFILGSAGGLLKVCSFFEGEKYFYYLNGDSLFFLEDEEALENFYQAHLQSGALASFLVSSTKKVRSVLWADKNGKIQSFLKKPEASESKAYDFCGLAIFSTQIFHEIQARDRHIFKDVLESKCVKQYLRIHCLSGLQSFSMNRLDTYLEATGQGLSEIFHSSKYSVFLKKALNLFSPRWDHFQGVNYFSGTRVSQPPEKQTDLLFCGTNVKGLHLVTVKDFSVLGDHSSIPSPITMRKSVLRENLSLAKDSDKELII